MRHRTARTIWLFAPFAVLFLYGCTRIQQEPTSTRTAEEVAEELATLSVDLGILDQTLDRGAEVAWESAHDALMLEIGHELTAEEQARGRATLRGVLAEFLTPEVWRSTVTQVYSEQFTATELERIIEFYGSDLGRKVIGLEDEVEGAIDAGMEAALGADRIEAFIERADEALAAEFPQLAGEAG